MDAELQQMKLRMRQDIKQDAIEMPRSRLEVKNVKGWDG